MMPFRRSFSYFAAIAALCALRIALGAALPFRALGSFTLDDLLLARLADSLLHGQWLGPYNHEILTVGPVYPLWIALAYRIGVPLILSHQLLYVAACLLVLRALGPLVVSAPARIAVFALLLFGPYSMDFEATRAVRDNFYTSLTLILLAVAWFRPLERLNYDSRRPRTPHAAG